MVETSGEEKKGRAERREGVTDASMCQKRKIVRVIKSRGGEGRGVQVDWVFIVGRHVVLEGGTLRRPEIFFVLQE